MKLALSMFMGIAITALVIATLVFDLGSETMNGETDKYETHIKENMDSRILNEMP